MKLVNELRAGLGTEVSSRPTIEPTGRLWPNGEFTVGYSRTRQEFGSDEEWAWTRPEKYLTANELDERLDAMHELLDEVRKFYSMTAELAASGLSLSNVWNSHETPTRTKNGLKGLTGFGTKMIRSGCFLLEDKLGKEDCVMITLTVPTLSRENRVKVAQRWGAMTNRLVQWLSRALLKAGRPPAIIGCVEIQTGRLKKYAQGYLHLHLVCPAHSNTGGLWAIDASALRTFWAQEIERTIGCDLTIMPRIETAIVNKSVEGYLGKYLSKGSTDELAAFVGDLGTECVPGQWWFASAEMKNAIKGGTVVGRNVGALLDSLVNHLLEVGTGDGFEYVRHVDCMMNDRPITVGWVGRLAPDLRRDVFAMLDSTT